MFLAGLLPPMLFIFGLAPAEKAVDNGGKNVIK